MDKKTYLKKLLRDLLRLEQHYCDSIQSRDWYECDIVRDDICSIEEAIQNSLITDKQYLKPNCYGLGDFIADLRSHYKKPTEDDLNDEGYRPHHCNIFLTHDNKEHLFEVRGWTMDGDKLIINACNGTLCAGACTLTVTKDNVKNMRIEGV